MDFQQAETEFKQLKTQFLAGSLSEADFKSQLERLMVQDKQGSWWMIGYETERWYRNDGTDWVLANPPNSNLVKPVPIKDDRKIEHKDEYVAEEKIKRNVRDLDKFARIAFILGIVSAITSCFYIGVIPAAIAIYYGFLGLKSSRRPEAIGGLILAFVAIGYVIFMLVFAIGSVFVDSILKTTY